MTAPRPLGFWLKLLDQLIDRRFEETLGEQGVSRRQWQLLTVLGSSSATSAELAASLAPFLQDEDPATLTEEVARLRARHWVDEHDDVLSVTGQGRTASEHLAGQVARSRRAVAEGISAAEYEQTLRVLERMARNLGWTDPAAAG